MIAGRVWDAEAWREGFWLRVLEFPDIYGKLPDEQGLLTFEVACGETAFVQSILDAARRFIQTHGIEGYKWGNNPFPMRALHALEVALITRDPSWPPPDPNAPLIAILASDKPQ